MIPKKIHYCWFGRGEKTKLAHKCINSWKKMCPDYEIIEWNEDNFDLNYNEYTQYCYENKKWAFLSDLVRLIVVEKYGGIYFDTDVEVISSFDKLLGYDAFFAFENSQNIASGLGFGSVARHSIVKEMIKLYDDFHYDSNGRMEMIGCPILNTKVLLSFGFKINGERQEIDRVVTLPVEYMNPYDDPTGLMNKTANTLSIHWYAKSALSRKAILRSNITRVFHRLFGKDCFEWIKRK
ncbi:glycosyltransferase [Faecalimonas hominis]